MAEDSWFRSIALTDLRLRVRDLERVATFYQSVLGFTPSDSGKTRRTLAGAADRHPLVVLEAAPAAPLRPRGTAGLFHVAFLYPSRAALAAALARVIAARIPIGSADHGVSEAVYLSDPEGNGIELYADRRRDEWPPLTPDGQVGMYTEPLDIDALLSMEGQGASVTPPRIGHVHLAVADLGHAERFYAGMIGLSVTQRSYPGALFLARDGYHHHVGTNVWRTHLVSVPDALGLADFTIRYARADDLEATEARLTSEGHPIERAADGVRTHDLDGIGLRLAAST